MRYLPHLIDEIVTGYHQAEIRAFIGVKTPVRKAPFRRAARSVFFRWMESRVVHLLLSAEAEVAGAFEDRKPEASETFSRREKEVPWTTTDAMISPMRIAIP